MDVINKNSKAKFWCHCGYIAARRAEFDDHLTSLHGVRLQKGAVVQTYAEGDVTAYPKVFRLATEKDTADLQVKNHKKYEKKMEKAAGRKASASSSGIEDPHASSQADSIEADAARTSPSPKRAKSGKCKVLQAAPPAAATENPASGLVLKRTVDVNRSRDTASKAGPNSR